MSAAVGGRVTLPVDGVTEEWDMDSVVDEDGSADSVGGSEGEIRVVCYKYYAGLPPYFHR